MGLAQTIAPLAVAASDPSAFTLVIVILGALFTLVLGGYVYTWKATSKIWEAFTKFSNHDFTKLRDRVLKIEGKLDD